MMLEIGLLFCCAEGHSLGLASHHRPNNSATAEAYEGCYGNASSGERHLRLSVKFDRVSDNQLSMGGERGRVSSSV